MSIRHVVAGRSKQAHDRRSRRSGSSGSAPSLPAVGELEVRLYAPGDPSALCFARVETPAQARSLSRRWAVARPGYRVEIAAAITPVPIAAD